MTRDPVPLFGKPYPEPKRARRKPVRKPVDLRVVANPPEYIEQEIVAEYLDARGFDWFHVPNEGRRSPITGARLKRQGLKKGCPDIHIWNQPPGLLGVTGVVAELKRRDATPSSVTPEQREWLERAKRHGKKARVCYGADDFIAWIEGLFGSWRADAR